MISRAIIASVALMAALAGCAAPGQTPISPPSSTPSSAPTSDLAARAQSNKQKADDEARRLLNLAQIPPQATQLNAAPTTQPGPALGAPKISSLIDHARFYRVPMSFDDTVAWVKAHPPTGLTNGGSMSGSGHGAPRLAGFTYTVPDSQAWIQAQLEIGIATDGAHASDIRIDGVTQWLDPRPQRVSASGKRLSVTVAGGCPQSDKGYTNVENKGGELDEAMLPTQIPTGGLLCVYQGLNGTPFALTIQRQLDAAAAKKLSDAVAGLSLAHLDADNVPISCPFDDGSVAVLVFSYAGGPDVAIWYHSRGCQSVSNGHIVTKPDDAFQRVVRPLL